MTDNQPSESSLPQEVYRPPAADTAIAEQPGIVIGALVILLIVLLILWGYIIQGA